MKQLGLMAIDQHGQTYHIGDNPPRKWLLGALGRKHAEKMYCDYRGEGKSRHIGYVIAGLWLRIYRVCDWGKTEK